MANIDNGFRVDVLSLEDQVLIAQGTYDPTVGAGYSAPTGSLFLRTNGLVYRKTDTADVDWEVLGGTSNLDHGNLVGLSDDDHTQYHNDARGDARYYTQTQLNAGQLDTRYYTETEVDTLLAAQDELNELVGVVITSPADHELLAYDTTSGNWINQTATEAGLIPSSEKGTANGVATLNGSSKIPTTQLPALALTDVSVVASEAAQLALTAQEGDIAIRTDENKSYAHNGGTAGTMADWSELLTPTDAVLSVNGQTGAVTLNIWSTINADAGSTTANAESDTLTVSGGTGISTSVTGDTLTITNDSLNVDQNLFQNVSDGTNTAVADTPTDTLTISGGPGIGVTVNPASDTVTIEYLGPSLYGRDYTYAESLGITSTTSETFLQKLRLTTPNIAAGTYRVGWSYTWNHDRIFSDFEAQVELDDTTQIWLHTEEPADSFSSYLGTGTNQKLTSSGFRILNLTSGVHTFDLDFRTNDNSDLSSIWNATIEFYRVE